MTPMMRQFKKKPIVVGAYQTDKPFRITTLEGNIIADKGDWIITGVMGEQYPCKPDIFELTYDEVFDEPFSEKDSYEAEIKRFDNSISLSKR